MKKYTAIQGRHYSLTQFLGGSLADGPFHHWDKIYTVVSVPYLDAANDLPSHVCTNRYLDEFPS
jgi:hypothetical protein